jgi:hypothetical protein
MIATIDRRNHWRPVSLEMSEEEFREMVEWLEGIAPQDGCTKDWRGQLDRLFPPDRVTE